MKFIVTVKGFLQTFKRKFDTLEEAETWLRKIGRTGSWIKIEEEAE